MDYKTLEKDSKKYQRDDAAYIHIEAKRGEGCSVFFTGDVETTIVAIASLIHRIQEKTGLDGQVITDAIGDMMDDMKPSKVMQDGEIMKKSRLS